MNYEKESIIYKKSFKFSLFIIETYKILIHEKKEFILSKQLLKCGTSIGANISESFHSQSIRDNLSKLYISLKEAGEANYWLDLLYASSFLNNAMYKTLKSNLNEIIKILSTIIKHNKLKLSSTP